MTRPFPHSAGAAHVLLLMPTRLAISGPNIPSDSKRSGPAARDQNGRPMRQQHCYFLRSPALK
jgi:hypothetical protein